MPDNDERPPLSAPGASLMSQEETEHRKKAMLVTSSLWMVAWFPLFIIAGPAYNGTATLGLAAVAVVTYFIPAVWIGRSGRFSEPFIQHSFLTFGVQERTQKHRHVGGMLLDSMRLVRESHYIDCDECGDEFVDGVREDWARQVVAFGIPLVWLETERSFFCMECRPAAWGDEQPTVETYDLKYPDRSDGDLADIDLGNV